MSQRGNQRSSWLSTGSSAPIWACRRSSRSESRCCSPPAGLVAGAADDLLRVGDDLVEVRGPERLEDDRRLARAAQPELGLERHARRAHREQAVGGGLLDLALAGEDVE